MYFLASDLTGTLINCYTLCHKKAWLQARHISPTRENSHLQMGSSLSKIRGTQERMGNFEVDEIKKGKHITIKEYKKTFSNIEASTTQLLLYMLNVKQELKCKKIDGFVISEETNEKKFVPFTIAAEKTILDICSDAVSLISNDTPPVTIETKVCMYCAHNLYCF
jgi:CRISPR-associated exonuclease Cas4